MSRPMIIAAGYVAVIAAVSVLIWTVQRRLMYFPTGGVPTPGEIGLTDVGPVTFETTDGLGLSGWFVAASAPSPRVTVLVFNGNAGFGESLGAAVAVDLAVEHPPAALVLRSPFTSMADVGQHHYPFLPVRLLLRDRFAAIDQIRRIRVPLLVIAGGHDRIVPIENSRRLYDTAVAPKTLLVLPDADHNDDELPAGDEMIRGIVRFLQPLR